MASDDDNVVSVEREGNTVYINASYMQVSDHLTRTIEIDLCYIMSLY